MFAIVKSIVYNISSFQEWPDSKLEKFMRNYDYITNVVAGAVSVDQQNNEVRRGNLFSKYSGGDTTSLLKSLRYVCATKKEIFEIDEKLDWSSLEIEIIQENI